jgi:hypothetical protein
MPPFLLEVKVVLEINFDISEKCDYSMTRL